MAWNCESEIGAAVAVAVAVASLTAVGVGLRTCVLLSVQRERRRGREKGKERKKEGKKEGNGPSQTSLSLSLEGGCRPQVRLVPVRLVSTVVRPSLRFSAS